MSTPHLGNILYPGGGSLIEKTRVEEDRHLRPSISISEALLHRDFRGGDKLYRLLWEGGVTKAERARNFMATRENSRKSSGRGRSHLCRVSADCTLPDIW